MMRRDVSLRGFAAMFCTELHTTAIGLDESRGLWTASAAKALAGDIHAQTDAALEALKQLKP
jgi:hypothetical protein